MAPLFLQLWKIVVAVYQFVRRCFLKLFLLPIYGGFAIVCGVFAGYLGSHYDDIVFNAYTPFFWSDAPMSWEATSFYVLTWIFGISFTGTYWAQAVTSRQSNQELHGALDKLGAASGFPRQLQQVVRAFL